MNLFRQITLSFSLIGALAISGCSLGEGGTETSVRTPTSGNSSGNDSGGLGQDSGTNDSNPGLGSDDASSDSNATSSVSAYENKAFDLVNEYRASKGKPALVWSSEIANVARGHSENMSDGSVAFGHDGFATRGETLQATVGWTSIGENVAVNNGFDDPATVAVNGWIGSPGHEANMVGNYTKTGMGVAISSDGSYYFTQIFIK